MRLDIDGHGGSIDLAGGSEISIESTFMEGTSNETSQSFAVTLGFEGPGFLSFVSGSLSKTYSTTTSVFSSRSTTKSFTVAGVANKTVIATVWTITEEFTYTDENGVPYTDPVWELQLPKLVLESTKERLQTWEF